LVARAYIPIPIAGSARVLLPRSLSPPDLPSEARITTGAPAPDPEPTAAMAYYGDRRPESSIVEAFTLSPLPYPVILILLMVSLLLGVSWFFTYEDFIEEAAEQFSWALLAVPIALVLLIRWISSVDSFDGYFSGFFPSERRWRPGYGSAPAEGSSPWGVAMLVLLLIVLASFHETIRDMWRP